MGVGDGETDALPNEQWWGVVFPSSGQFRITRLSINTTTGEATVGPVEVRMDIWSKWLDMARTSRDEAAAARDANPADNSPEFHAAMEQEMRASMQCICAVAFALEAFTGSVTYHQPHTSDRTRRQNDRGTAAAGRIHQVWTRAFLLHNRESTGIRTTLRQVFGFRNQAVHPSAAFVIPVRHPDYPVAVEPRYLMFRADNAATAVQFAEQVLAYLLAHPRGADADWLSWCQLVLPAVTGQPPPQQVQ